jgi:hypothetical protein
MNAHQRQRQMTVRNLVEGILLIPRNSMRMSEAHPGNHPHLRVGVLQPRPSRFKCNRRPCSKLRITRRVGIKRI